MLDLKQPYLVVMQHPVTTEYLEARQHAVETIEAIDSLGLQTLWFWPNVDAGSDGYSISHPHGARTWQAG